MTLKQVALAAFLSIIPAFLFAQEGSIKGQLTDKETGETIPAANVFIGSLARGTATDMDGNFLLENIATGTYKIQFSSIGYSTLEMEIAIKPGENILNASLKVDIGMLDEIVVAGVAEGTSVKKLTVSVARIDAEKLNMVPGQNINSALSGKVSGIQIQNTSGLPGASPNIQLRSDNTLGNSSPMLVVDGLIMEGSLADLNTDDVANVEVVRGAAASALYGSRASNGVIVVTTKRGDNVAQGKIDITFRNEIGVQELQRTMDLANGHQFELADDWEQFSEYTRFAGVTYPDGYAGGFDARIAVTRTESADGFSDNPFAFDTDPQNSFFENGASATNFISMAGRSGKLNYYSSFERFSSQGVLPEIDGYQRSNFRLNADYRVNDWLKVSTSNLSITTTSDQPQDLGVFFDVVLAEPDNRFDLVNPDGQPYYVRHNQWSNETNPIYNLYKNEFMTNTRRNLSNVSVDANPTDWLTYKFLYSHESDEYSRESFTPFDTYDANLVYTQGGLSIRDDQRENQNLQHTLTGRKIFGDLAASVTLSYIWEKSVFETNTITGNNFTVPGVPSIDAILPENINGTSFQSEVQAENYFANISLDYKDRYLLNALYRRDGSSQFGADARWNDFYRVSGAYRISEDIKIPNVQELKIRAAVGTAGLRPGFAAQYEVIGISNGNLSKNQLGNRLLRPSVTTETEIGLNATVFNRFSFEAIYSLNETVNEIVNVPLIPVAGFSSQAQNAVSLTGSTMEFTLAADWIRSKDLNWTTNFVWSASEQEISGLNRPPFFSGPDDLFQIAEGERYGAIFGRAFVRTLDQMQAQQGANYNPDAWVVNSDGYVIPAGTEGTTDEAAQLVVDDNGAAVVQKIGDGRPDWIAGIANTVAYKNFSFYILFDIKQGGDVYNRKAQWLTRDNRNGIMDMIGVADDQKKTINYFQSFYDVNSNNEYWVEDGSFVKLRELAISYSVPRDVINRIAGNFIKDAKLSLIGRNLFTWTNYTGYDPEVGSIRNPVDGVNTYPLFRQYSASLTLKF